MAESEDAPLCMHCEERPTWNGKPKQYCSRSCRREALDYDDEDCDDDGVDSEDEDWSDDDEDDSEDEDWSEDSEEEADDGEQWVNALVAYINGDVHTLPAVRNPSQYKCKKFLGEVAKRCTLRKVLTKRHHAYIKAPEEFLRFHRLAQALYGRRLKKTGHFMHVTLPKTFHHRIRTGEEIPFRFRSDRTVGDRRFLVLNVELKIGDRWTSNIHGKNLHMSVARH